MVVEVLCGEDDGRRGGGVVCRCGHESLIRMKGGCCRGQSGCCKEPATWLQVNITQLLDQGNDIFNCSYTHIPVLLSQQLTFKCIPYCVAHLHSFRVCGV